MLEDAEKDLQMGHYTHSEIDTMFKDIVAQTVGDGVNTQTEIVITTTLKNLVGKHRPLQLYVMSLQSTIAPLHHCLSFLSI